MRFLRDALEVAAYAAGSFLVGVVLLCLSPWFVLVGGIAAAAILTDNW